MANILKQIKVGNTTYNIEPVTAYLPLSGGTINANNSKAPLILKGGASNWNEGLRIIPTNNWATILLAGTDADENTGTSAKSWSIHNYDGSFYISKNGSDYASTKLSNTDGTWRVNDNDIIHSGNIGSQNVNYANSAGLVEWGNVNNKPITITQRNNDSPISGAYAWGTHVTMRNANNWFEIYAPHMGTSSDRVYMQTGWDNDRQGWKAIAWTSDIPTSLPANGGNADTVDGKHSSDFCLSNSNITNLPINGGIYWNSYVESSSDGSDAASITVIRDGNGSGGTVLQIKQANDSNDIVNVVAGDLKVNGNSVIHSGNIGSQNVNYANGAGNADTLDGSHASAFATASHIHTNLKSNTDNRNSNTTPNDYNGVLNIAGLKDNSKIGLDTNIYGTYSCLIGVRGWQDSSGGDSHEIALTGNGQIMHRSGSTTSWGGWDKIAHTSYIDTYFPRAKVGSDSPYSNVYTSFIGGVSDGPRGTGWEFLYRAEHRNGAGDGPNYIMEMVSNLTSDSSIYWRKKTGGSFTSFREIIDSNNIGSQNVNYANSADHANSANRADYADSAGSAGSVAWGNIGGKPSTFPATVDSSLSSNSNNPVKNSAIYSEFSKVVGFDHDKYGFGDNGSWRLQEYHGAGNSLDIRYGKINIDAQEKTYNVSFGANKSLANTNYTIVFGINRSNRNSWFWSPLVKTRDKTGFTVYVRGNTSGDNSGTLMYIAIRSN